MLETIEVLETNLEAYGVSKELLTKVFMDSDNLDEYHYKLTKLTKKIED